MHMYDYTEFAPNKWMCFTSLQHPDGVIIHSTNTWPFETTFPTKHLRVVCLIQLRNLQGSCKFQDFFSLLFLVTLATFITENLDIIKYYGCIIL